MSAKKEFIKIYEENIRREGSGNLLAWLEKTDFFTAPASTRYHGAYEGGLVEHSIHVYKRLITLCNAETEGSAEFKKPSGEALAICGLLHDICKADFYTVQMRNAKNEKTGQWEKVPYYAVEDKLPYGHGEKSVYIISGFMKLSREEAMAIRWHMGGFDESVKGGSFALNGAFEKYPLALLTHLADMQATYLDETKEEKA